MPLANPTFCLKTHKELPTMTEDDVRANGAEVLKNADQGIQTAIVGTDGRLRSVIGLNGVRYLPDPDPDPLDEVIRMALETAPKEPE